MSEVFHREYLVRLSLPLAQLYSRAYNAKDARGRHNNAFYLLEALIKLGAAPLIESYLQEVERGGPRVANIDRQLTALALPSLGQWVGMFRELARYFGARPDAASHPLGHLWKQLSAKRRDLPAIVALYRRIKNGADGAPAGDQSCSLLQLLDALVQYRNGVFGHGAGRFDSFYEQEMGPLLFPAVNELLQAEVLGLLGPPGTRLVYLTELRTLDENRHELSLRELVGMQAERMSPLELTSAQAANVLPHRVAVLWPGQRTPLPLEPLLVYRERDQGEEVLFLNCDRNGRQVELLSYTTGRTERDKTMAPAMARLLTRVAGRPVQEEELGQLREQCLAESAADENLRSAPAPQGQVLGEFEILAEIGRGGMGVVYLARQLSLGRLVALKMLPANLAGDELALARFRREMRSLSRCEHPHIVKVLSSGTLDDGQLYYAMEYVPGTDLEHVWRELSGAQRQGDASDLGGSTWYRAVIDATRKQRETTARRAAGEATRGSLTDDTTAGSTASDEAALRAARQNVERLLPPLPELPAAEDDPGGYARRVAALLRDAALGMQAVHDQGVVHRDVKPANLMLTADGSRVVLMDFGLAKGQSLAVTKTAAGGFLGTLRYAAPEQLAAAKVQVDHRADVRALGITLWELLTRRRVFEEAEDENQLAAWVLNKDLPLLRSVDASLDADLEAIVARAADRDAERRIQTARELAEYLELYLAGKPLPIRPPGLRELGWRWVKRHRALVATAAAAAAAVVFITLAALIVVFQAWSSERETNRRLAASNTKLEATNDQLGTALNNLAVANREKDQALGKEKVARQDAQANEQLARESEQEAEESRKLAEAGERDARRNLYISHILLAHQALQNGEIGRALDKLHTGSWSGDNEQYAALRGWESFYLEGLARTQVTEFRGHQAPVNSVDFSPCGRWVAAGDSAGKLILWDVSTGQVAPFWNDRKIVKWEVGFRYSEGKLKVFGHQPFAEEPHSLPPVGSEIVALSNTPGEMYRVSDLSSQEVHELIDVGQGGSQLTVLVAAAEEAEPVRHTLRRRLVDPMEHSRGITCVRFSHNGQWLATASGDGYVIVSEMKPGKQRQYVFKDSVNAVHSVAFEPDDRRLATAGESKIWVHELSGWRDVAITCERDDHFGHFAFSPHGRLASGSKNGKIRLWDPETGDMLRELASLENGVLRLAYPRSGDRLLVQDASAKLHVLDLVEGTQAEPVKLDVLALARVTCQRSGDAVATGTVDGDVLLWDRVGDFTERPQRFAVHSAVVSEVAFSPDGRHIASGSWDGTVKITDVRQRRRTDFELARIFDIRPSGSGTVTFSPDGRRVLIMGNSRLQIRDAATGEELETPAGVLSDFNGTLRAITSNDDSNRIAFADREGLLRIVDVTSGSVIAQFPDDKSLRHSTGVEQLALNADASLLASADKQGTICIWDTEVGQLLHTLKAEVGNPHNLVFSPSSDMLAAIHTGGLLNLWDVRQGTLLETLLDHHPYRTTFHPSGSRLVVGGINGVIAIWDLEQYEQVQLLRGHRGGILRMAWNQDASRLVTCAGDGAIIVWEPDSGQPLVVLPGDDLPAPSVAFDPDEKRLASLAGDGRKLAFWDAALLGREPSADDWFGYYLRGCVRGDLEQWPGAASDYERALELGADLEAAPALPAKLWWARCRARDYEAALADLDQQRQEGKDDGPFWLRRYLIRAAAEGLEAAERDFVSADLQTGGALSVRGNHLWSARRSGSLENRPGWQRLAAELEIDPPPDQDERAWSWQRARGLANLALRRFETAEAAFLLATQIRPHDARGWYGLARARADQNKWQDACQAGTQALDPFGDNSWQLWYLRGVCRQAAEQWEGAAEDFFQACQSNAEVWGPYAERAAVLAQLGQFDDAMVDMEQAVERAVDDPSRYALARHYRSIGQALQRGDEKRLPQAYAAIARSVQMLKELAQRDPQGLYFQSLGASLNQKGHFEQEQGQLPAALQSARAALEAMLRAQDDPTLPKIKQNISATYSRLASLHLEMGNFAEAAAASDQRVAHWRQQFQKSQDQADKKLLCDALTSLSYHYVFNREPEKVLAAVQEALELDPSLLLIRTNEFHAYLFSDRLPDAFKMLQKYRLEKVNDEETFGDLILRDFSELKEKGIDHPAMRRFELLLRRPDR